MANPNGFRFLPGTQVILWSRTWVIEQPLGDGAIPLRAAEGTERQLFGMHLLRQLLSEGKLEFVDHRSRTEIARQQVYARAELGLNDDQQAKVDRWVLYIGGLTSRGIEAYSIPIWKRAIEEIAKEINDPFRRPHPITLWRKRRQFRLAGCLPTATIGHAHLMGNREVRSDAEAWELMEKFVEERWLTPQKLTISHVHEDYEHQVNVINETRAATDKIVPVSYRVMWSHVRKLPQALVVLRRDGPQAAEKEYRQCSRAPKPTRVLELVETDHSPLDIVLIDRAREIILGPAYLTVSICVHSKVIAGLHVGYSPPSGHSVAQMMKFMILDKTPLLKLIPTLRHAHPAYGLPETLVVDNAREFYSRGFIRLCAQLGINLRYARRRKPWWKPHIERLIKSMNYGFSHALPGTRFGNPGQKGDYDSTKHALVDFNDFTAALMKWVCDFYHCRPHRGLGGRTPLQVWEEGVELYPPSLPRSRDNLNALVGLRATRVIGRMGIEFEHLFFNSEPLQLLRQQTPLKQQCSVEIVVDEDDLSAISVLDPRADEPLRVPCLDQPYAAALTLHQHRVILRNVANAGKRYVDRPALLKAKHEAFQMALGAFAKQSKASAKSLAARYLNLQQTVQQSFDVTNLPSVDTSLIHVSADALAEPIPDAHAADLLASLRDRDLEDDGGWGVSLDPKQSDNESRSAT
jgi:putative transposase